MEMDKVVVMRTRAIVLMVDYILLLMKSVKL